VNSSRRLAAIMFTDIQGYTSLMQKSEVEALSFRKKHREIFEKETATFHGRIIQYYGDGTLSVFESVVDAVHCAIAMQRRFIHEGKIPVRIGIHEGDIMIAEEDIIGDSVNLASRIKSLGVAGSVMISEKVYDDVKNSEDIYVVYIGSYHLKNVSQPVKVYAVSNEGLVVPQKHEIKGKLEKSQSHKLKKNLIPITIMVIFVLGWIFIDQLSLDNESVKYQSIVVLPFDNFTGNEEMDYFVQGMHSSLIGDLGKVSALRVISPTTARSFAQSGKSIPEIAQELGVDVVLEASVHSLGDSVGIQPRLIAVKPNEKQLWVEDFYQDKRQILNLYNQITKKISTIINVPLNPEEESQLSIDQEIDPKAYELYLKGQINLDRISPSSLESAFQYFSMASEIEPEWAAPYAGMSSVFGYQSQMGFMDHEEGILQKVKYLDKALELDSTSAEAHYEKAVHACWNEFKWEKAEKEYKKCIGLNPNHALSRMGYAQLLNILRRTDEALEQAELAAQLDPSQIMILGLHAIILIDANQCSYALEQLEKGLKIEPDHPLLISWYGPAKACLGDQRAEFDSWKAVNIDLWERYKVTELLEQIFEEEGWIAVQQEAIRLNEELYAKDGLMDFYAQGRRYFLIGDYDKAVGIWQEQALPVRDPNLPFISTNSI
jgi:adenylate cyclase